MAELPSAATSKVRPADLRSEATSKVIPADLRRRLRAESWQRAKQMRLLYLLFLLPLAIFVLFHYLPMYGNIIAFKDFRLGRGFWGSRWVGLQHFEDFFRNPYAWRIIRNTVVISGLKLLWGFPAPILLALLVNELTSQRFKKTVQTVSYLPHFMSWIILATILSEILSPQSGPIAQIAVWLGRPPPEVLTTGSLFRPMLIVTEIWKEMGWQSVIYLAALASIDPELYESATVDGANRMQRSVHITLPSLLPVITILAILRIGNLLNAGFDQIFNLYNPLVYEVSDIIDTFVYRRSLGGEGGRHQYDFAAAVGLFKSVMAVLLILGAHKIARRLTGQGVW